MYWPVGTPRIYATTSSSQTASATFNLVVSNDGLQSPIAEDNGANDKTERASLLTANSTSSQDNILITPQTPITPITPQTPGIKSVEQDLNYDAWVFDTLVADHTPATIPKEPILALRVARTGHIFAVITATTMTIWQAKPTVILAIVVRSEASLKSYGTNLDLQFRPDSAIFLVRTSLGYLITYSLATAADSRVYNPFFTSHTNVQRRRQSHWGGPGHAAPDQILWGPGEGHGVRDISVRFRMVIKVDAGIESALAHDDEIVVGTSKPAAVQCIRYSADDSGRQTSTELLNRMPWLGKKVAIIEMTHDRLMNLSTWITSDGRAYAVQRTPKGQPNAETGEPDLKKLFKGYCFHIPKEDHDYGTHAVINARFSLIALGCADGTIRVYSVKDYSGNIPASHTHKLSVSQSNSGALTTMCYSPDGYCLFAGYETGWATWSVYGKPLSNSFGVDHKLVATNDEQWISGVRDASWLGGGSEILMVGWQHEALWLLEMARSAVTGCYSASNLFRTVLQTTSSVMIYRGYDLPDMSSISAEPFLWHTARIPATYLLNQWPIRCTVISADGRYLAVAGRRGLAHYSINSGRWKTFANEAMESEFSVRGGMCWWQTILVAAVEANKSYELRLYSREKDLDNVSMVFIQQMPAPIVLITLSGEDSLLVYTFDNLLYHFTFRTYGNAVRLEPQGTIAFHGTIRSPARVRGLSWILPESQLLDGNPADDVAHAAVLFLVDGKLVLLWPSLNDTGQVRYDMRIIAQNVEYYVSMKEQPFSGLLEPFHEQAPEESENEDLSNSLWMFDGNDLKSWTDMRVVIESISNESHRELPSAVSICVDYYPLSVLLEKAIILGVEPDLVQRRDINFSFFRFSIRTHLFLPDILRHHVTANKSAAALHLAQQYQHLAYFAHALEILLHHVLDEEVDTLPPPSPENAIIPRVLSLLSCFKQYHDIVVQCTRKTEVRSWRTLFAYLPPARELFEESLQNGSLKTAGGYLLILHTFDELSSASEQSVRLLSRAMREEDWELCKELARFLAAMDETGDTLREALAMANVGIPSNRHQNGISGSSSDGTMVGRLGVPHRLPRATNGSKSTIRIGSGSSGSSGNGNGHENGDSSVAHSPSDDASIGSSASLSDSSTAK